MPPFLRFSSSFYLLPMAYNRNIIGLFIGLLYDIAFSKRLFCHKALACHRVGTTSVPSVKPYNLRSMFKVDTRLTYPLKGNTRLLRGSCVFPKG